MKIIGVGNRFGVEGVSHKVELWGLIAVMCLAAIVRFFVLGVEGRIIPTDGPSFIEIAKNIANHFDFYHAMFTPGYPVWVALVQKLTGLGWLAAGQWTSYLFSILLIIPLYGIFRRCVSVQSAMLGLLFYSCLPIWVEIGTESQSMSVGSFWFFAAVFLSLEIVVHKQRSVLLLLLLLAGVSLGLAALTRPELLVAGVVLPLWIILRSEERFKSIKPWLILLVTLTVYAPYVILLHEHTGHWQISMKSEIAQKNAVVVGQNNFHEAREKVLQTPDEALASGGLLHFWFSDPVATIKRMLTNVYLMQEYIWPAQFPVMLSFFLALGLVFGSSKNMDVLLVVSIVYLPSMALLVDSRILLPWATFFLAWAGLGASYLLEKWNRLGFIVLMVTVILLVGSALHIKRQANEEIAARTAGVWLKSKNIDAHAVVWDRKPWVAFYANAQHKHLPRSNKLIDFVDAFKTGDWLVVDSRHFAVARPDIYAQFFSGNKQTNLLLKQQFKGVDGHILNLYQVQKE